MMKVQFLLGYAEPPNSSEMRRWLSEAAGSDMVEWHAVGHSTIRPAFLNFPAETIRIDAFPDRRRFYGTLDGMPLLWSPETAFSNVANALRLFSILDTAIVSGGAEFWMVGGEPSDIVEPQPWQFLESAAFGLRDLSGFDALEAGFIRWGSAFVFVNCFDRILETFSRSDSLEDLRSRSDRVHLDVVADARAVQAKLDRDGKNWQEVNAAARVRMAEIQERPAPWPARPDDWGVPESR